jgi:hypothetical protein
MIEAGIWGGGGGGHVKTEVVSRPEMRRALNVPMKATKKRDSASTKPMDICFFCMTVMRDTALAVETTLATERLGL